MLARNNNKINGVLAANDGIAGAVVSALKNKHLKPIPLTGQDATPTGVQYIVPAGRAAPSTSPSGPRRRGGKGRDQPAQGTSP